MESILKDKICYAVIDNEIYQCKFESMYLNYTNKSKRIFVESFKLNIAGIGTATYYVQFCNGRENMAFEKGESIYKEREGISSFYVYNTADDAIAQVNEIFRYGNHYPCPNDVYFDYTIFSGCDYSDIYNYINENYSDHINIIDGIVGTYIWDGMSAVYKKLNVRYDMIRELMSVYECCTYNHSSPNKEKYYSSAESCKTHNAIKIHTF